MSALIATMGNGEMGCVLFVNLMGSWFQIQGNLMLASLLQVILGCTGLIGFFLRFIGPLTIAPTIALIGLSLTGVSAEFNEVHWGISFL